MKSRKGKTRVRVPRPEAGYGKLADFFDRHDTIELIEKGITESDPNREELERLLLLYWQEPNTKQLNIRIPAAAKRMIEQLAKRKTVEVSTLVRMWVIESMRRDILRSR